MHLKIEEDVLRIISNDTVRIGCINVNNIRPNQRK